MIRIFPIILILARFRWIFRVCRCTGTVETEIIYVKSGRGMVNVDGISYPVVKDSIVFILPGRLHSIAQYESEAFSYENIIFDIADVNPKRRGYDVF